MTKPQDNTLRDFTNTFKGHAFVSLHQNPLKRFVVTNVVLSNPLHKTKLPRRETAASCIPSRSLPPIRAIRDDHVRQ